MYIHRYNATELKYEYLFESVWFFLIIYSQLLRKNFPIQQTDYKYLVRYKSTISAQKCNENKFGELILLYQNTYKSTLNNAGLVKLM